MPAESIGGHDTHPEASKEGKINGLLDQALAFTPTIGTAPADVIGESMVRQANAGYMPESRA